MKPNRTARSALMAKALPVVLCLAASPSMASAAPSRGEVLAKNGNAAGATPCVVCHGVAGQGQPAAGFPRLAGLNALYVAGQLKAFREGSRDNPVMGPIAKALGDADGDALGAYFASLKAADDSAPTVADPTSVAAGRQVALQGDWDRGVPGCAQCHGAHGLGVGSAFPPLAGQSASYLASQLEAWRSGTRKNDPMHLMQGIAAKLDAQDVRNVAYYYASLSAVPPVKGAKP